MRRARRALGTPWRRGHARLALVAVCVGVAGAIPDPNSLTVFHESNAAVRVYQLEAILYDGRLSIEGPLCRAGPGRFSSIDMARGADGRPYPSKAPGPVWFALPAYGLLYLVAGGPPPLHWAQAWLARLTQWLPLLAAMAWWGTRWLGSRRAGVLVVLAGAASPFFVYGGMFQDYPLATAFLLVGATLAFESRALGSAFAAGACLAAAGATNYAFILSAGVVVATLAACGPGPGRSRWTRAAAVCAGAIPVVAALLAYHTVAFGSPWDTPYDHLYHASQRVNYERTTWRWSALATVLFDGKAGLFSFLPWAIFGVLGLGGALRHEALRPAALAALGVVAANVLFVAAWTSSHADLEPFNRHLLGSVPFLAAGAVHWVDRLPAGWRRRAGAAALAGAALPAALVAFATAWTFPFHPPGPDVPAPAWSVNVPLLVRGVHLEPWAPTLYGATHAAPPPPHWGWVALSAALVAGAAGAAVWMARGRVSAWSAGLAVAVALLVAALEVGRLPERPSEATRRWTAQAIHDVVASHGIPAGAGWRATGYPDNPHCAMAAH